MKLIKACIALAAFAALMVAPSIASAGVTLTDPTGTTAPINSLVEAINVEHSTTPTQTVFTTNVGNVTCGTATLTGKVLKSDPSLEGEITTAEFGGTHKVTTSGHCQGNFIIGEKVTPTPSHTSDEDKSLPWCITAETNDDKFKVRGGKCSEVSRPITFTLHGNITCTYETPEIVGTYTTHPADAIATINEQKATRSANSSAFCPKEGFLDMAFTMFTDGKPTAPFYIDKI